MRALSRITAISTYYPSCLSAEWPCGHALAPGKLNGPLWGRGEEGTERERMGGMDRGPGDTVRGSQPLSPELDLHLLWASPTWLKPAVRHFCHCLFHQRDPSQNVAFKEMQHENEGKKQNKWQYTEKRVQEK